MYGNNLGSDGMMMISSKPNRKILLCQVHIELKLKCTINNVTTAHLTGSTNGLLVSLWLGIFVTGENSPEPELHSHAV